MRKENNGCPVATIRELTGNEFSEHHAKKACTLYEQFLEKILSDSTDELELEGQLRGATTYNNGEQVVEMLHSILNLKNKTPQELLELHDYDVTQYEFVKHDMNMWSMYSKKDGISGLMSSRLRVKKLQDLITKNQFIEIYKDIELPKIEDYTYTDGDKLLLIGLVDIHLGKQCHELEVGYTHTIEDTIKEVKEKISELVYETRQRNIKLEKIILPIGQDFFNVDNNNNTTTSGTPQDTYIPHVILYRKGLELLFWIVEKLRKEAPVDLYYIQGNHDYHVSFHAYETLRARYMDNKTINFCDSVEPRQYIKYGKCLIGLGHGDNEKVSDLDKIMPAEADKLWSSTEYRELVLSHKHQRILIDSKGHLVRRLSCLSPSDRWSNKKAYIGTLKQLQSLVYDKEKGMRYEINIT